MHWDKLFLPALAARVLFLPVLVHVRELSRHDIVVKVAKSRNGQDLACFDEVVKMAKSL